MKTFPSLCSVSAQGPARISDDRQNWVQLGHRS